MSLEALRLLRAQLDRDCHPRDPVWVAVLAYDAGVEPSDDDWDGVVLPLGWDGPVSGWCWPAKSGPRMARVYGSEDGWRRLVSWSLAAYRAGRAVPGIAARLAVVERPTYGPLYAAAWNAAVAEHAVAAPAVAPGVTRTRHALWGGGPADDGAGPTHFTCWRFPVSWPAVTAVLLDAWLVGEADAGPTKVPAGNPSNDSHQDGEPSHSTGPGVVSGPSESRRGRQGRAIDPAEVRVAFMTIFGARASTGDGRVKITPDDVATQIGVTREGLTHCLGRAAKKQWPKSMNVETQMEWESVLDLFLRCRGYSPKSGDRSRLPRGTKDAKSREVEAWREDDDDE